MPTFKITLAYDGTDFVGWQRQASGVSVQGLLENALRELDGRDVPVAGAGRTDAGVHALGQVAGFSLDRALAADAVTRALNARLPDSVRVLAAEETIDTFHPRFGARAKSYRYRIWNGSVGSPFERRYAWHIHEPLDVEAMDAAARIVEGSHDFAAFQASGSATTTTVREIFSSKLSTTEDTEDAEDKSRLHAGSNPRGPSVLRGEEFPGRLVTFQISGNGFLRHMVRTIVGTLVEVGRGRQRPEWMAEVIGSGDRAIAGPTAPPEGLFLVGVEY
jgi:tRNA pseudouridine38-40 synthase